MSQGSGVDAFVERYRAQPNGYYREFPPSPDLRDFIACGWIRAVRTPGGEPRAPIIPDGCTDIMTFDDGPPFVVGPDAVTRWVSLHDGLVFRRCAFVRVLRRRSWAARPWSSLVPALFSPICIEIHWRCITVSNACTHRERVWRDSNIGYEHGSSKAPPASLGW
ncbi:MAG TPA: DUF6597 domain-containing transcriptional factor [Polyangiaceae bacterium]|nr:DUF6597 domain-containing transcriptional factor [Polyangiaceae bacterium]